MLEVRPIDSELVVSVELGLDGVVAGPGVGSAAFQYVHPVVDGRAGEVTEHVGTGR